MEGFFYWLILLVIIVAYTFLIIFMDRKLLSMEDPDAVLSFTEKEDKVNGNFLLLLPIDLVRQKDYIRVEIQNRVQEVSLEDVIDSVE